MQHKTYIIAIIKTINGDLSISHGEFGDFRGDFGKFQSFLGIGLPY